MSRNAQSCERRRKWRIHDLVETLATVAAAGKVHHFHVQRESCLLEGTLLCSLPGCHGYPAGGYRQPEERCLSTSLPVCLRYNLGRRAGSTNADCELWCFNMWQLGLATGPAGVVCRLQRLKSWTVSLTTRMMHKMIPQFLQHVAPVARWLQQVLLVPRSL